LRIPEKVTSNIFLICFCFNLFYQASTYLNSKNVNLTDSSFLNNNYDLEVQSYHGGFLDIQSNNFIASNSSFSNSIGNKGSAVSISPSEAGAKYQLISCNFTSLIA